MNNDKWISFVHKCGIRCRAKVVKETSVDRSWKNRVGFEGDYGIYEREQGYFEAVKEF